MQCWHASHKSLLMSPLSPINTFNTPAAAIIETADKMPMMVISRSRYSRYFDVSGVMARIINPNSDCKKSDLGRPSEYRTTGLAHFKREENDIFGGKASPSPN